VSACGRNRTFQLSLRLRALRHLRLVPQLHRFKIFLLRRHGRQLPLHKAQNRKTYIGRLVTQMEGHAGERYSVTTLQPDEPMSVDRPPQLYEAVLFGFAPLAFRLRGFERVEEGDKAYSVVQEWHVEGP
jgi:hypothetical protein